MYVILQQQNMFFVNILTFIFDFVLASCSVTTNDG